MMTFQQRELFNYLSNFQREFELLRDKYSRGSPSYNLNDGKASAFQMLAGDVREGCSPIIWRDAPETQIPETTPPLPIEFSGAVYGPKSERGFIG